MRLLRLLQRDYFNTVEFWCAIVCAQQFANPLIGALAFGVSSFLINVDIATTLNLNAEDGKGKR